MTENEIGEFRTFLRSRFISLFGYTSTTTDRDVAMGFAWENEVSGHRKVLFEIKWMNQYLHFYLDGGAYDYEQEIVLLDAVQLYVWEVRDEKKYTHIVLGTNTPEENDYKAQHMAKMKKRL